MIPQKLNDSHCPCRDYVGIIIFFAKNSRIPQKLIDSSKTGWWLSRCKKLHQPLVTYSDVGINTADSHEKQWDIRETYWLHLKKKQLFLPRLESNLPGGTVGYPAQPGLIHSSVIPSVGE